MKRLAVELSVYNNSEIDLTYELIIIMMHLNHDTNLTVQKHEFIDDSAYSDHTHGYLLLDFINCKDCNSAAQVLTFRGYNTTLEET